LNILSGGEEKMPSQFSTEHLELILGAFAQVVLIAMLVERALAVLFEAAPIKRALEGSLAGNGTKQIVAVVLS
jgi:hypothetical protein